MLHAKALVAGHDGKALLGPLELTLQAGEFTCLIGANGAGKSTLIRTLCGMQPAIAGEVRINAAPLVRMSAAQRARELAVVLTDRIDVDALSGYDLVCLGRYPHIGWGGRLAPDDHAAVRCALAQAGADGLAARKVADLSDGERQKLLVARALAQDPRVLVLDEATAFLDLPRRVGMMRLLRDLARARGLAILLSTHDLELAMRYADTLWMLDPARQLVAGAPEDLALAGALSRTFAAQGLAFDLERGELVLGSAGRRSIQLDGQGVPLAWARRALQRAGFRVDSGAPSCMTVAGGRYTLRTPGEGAVGFETLGQLVRHLEAAPAGER
jgi:iron complex transport system ATP-binding protein